MAVGVKQKVAIVSGSTSGIGLEIATHLLEAGYFVYLNGRQQETSEPRYAELKDKYSAVGLLLGDISDQENYSLWKKQLLEKHTSVDVLVSNVGSGRYANQIVADIAEYKQCFEANFFSAITFSQQFLDLMTKNGAAMIFISSIAGVMPIGAPISYACAKAALIMYSKELAMRLAEKKIRVNSISPGNVMFKGSVWERKVQLEPESTMDYINTNVPLQAFVEPLAIAKTVLMLSQTETITGQNIVIDCGQTKGVA